MKEKKSSDRGVKLGAVLAAAAAGWLCWNAGSVCLAQTAPANLSPGLQEVIKLTQAHMADDVIIAYIKNSGSAYSLSANDILYLNSQGVSQPVISTLLQAKPAADANPAPSVPPPPAPVPEQQNYGPGPGAAPALAPVPQASAPAPAPDSAPGVSFDYFHDKLSPYGTWIDMPGYGPCFRPTDAATPGWRPYCDGGHWVYTDDGWFWQSDYPWGEIAFHYGRWHYSLNYGWLWVPGYDYAPAWVCWRHAEGAGYCGWAPLPPGAVFRAGVGLMFNGRVALDIDFGLNQTYFTFVPYDHFWDHDFRVYVAPRDRVAFFYRSSVIMNNYHVVGGRFVIEGLGHERIAALTHHEVRVERVMMRDERIARRVEARRIEDRRVEEHRTVEDRARVDSRDARTEHGELDKRSSEDNSRNSYSSSKDSYRDSSRSKSYSSGKQSSSGGSKSDSQGKNGDPKR